jgi:hypothetical protein
MGSIWGVGWVVGVGEGPISRRRQNQHAAKCHTRLRYLSHPLDIGEKRNTYRTAVGNLKETDCVEGLGVDWKTGIKTALRETWRQSVDWIHLVQNWETWQTFTKRVMNIRVTRNARKILTEVLLSFETGLFAT